MWSSGARPDLSLEDEEVKRKLVKCASRAYSELIRSDIPGLSSVRPARLPFLRPSPLSVLRPLLPSVSKPSSSLVLDPSTAKPTRGELRARMEVLAKKKRSVKRKPQAFPEGFPPAQCKALKAGASSSPSSVEPPFEVLPISVWSPTSRGGVPSPAMPDEVRRDRFGAIGSEDSLLSHAELAIGVVSSILRDSDLRKVDALSVEEALALLLKGIASVCPSVLADPFLHCFNLVN